MTTTNTLKRITLAPKAGFCVKTSVIQTAIYNPPKAHTSDSNKLELSDGQTTIPRGFKIFINIAWDANVPPPPAGSEEAIQKAMLGEDVDNINPDAWYVPVIVSEGRLDKDKAGKPSLVFDCVYNPSVKTRTLKDPEFKIFLIELALQRLEAQTSLVLSRQIGTPNISAKGKLEPRTVSIPAFLLQPPADSGSSKGETEKEPLIQEVASTSTPAKTKGILKKSMPLSSQATTTSSKLTWTWAKEPDSKLLRISIPVPSLPRNLIAQSTLDIEPRRLILSVPQHQTLDLDTSISDAEIAARMGGDEEGLMRLRKERPFDVDGARAEWKVAEGKLDVYV